MEVTTCRVYESAVSEEASNKSEQTKKNKRDNRNESQMINYRKKQLDDDHKHLDEIYDKGFI